MYKCWQIIVSALFFSMLFACSRFPNSGELGDKTGFQVSAENKVFEEAKQRIVRQVLNDVLPGAADNPASAKRIKTFGFKPAVTENAVRFRATAKGKTLKDAKQAAIQKALNQHSDHRVISRRALNNESMSNSFEVLQNAVVQSIYVEDVFELAGYFYITLSGRIVVGSTSDVNLPSLNQANIRELTEEAYDTLQTERIAQTQSLNNMFSNTKRYFHGAYFYHVVDKIVTSVLPEKISGFAVIEIAIKPQFWRRYADVLSIISSLSGGETIFESSQYESSINGACSLGKTELTLADRFVVPVELNKYLAYPLQLTFTSTDTSTQNKSVTVIRLYKNMSAFGEFKYSLQRLGQKEARSVRDFCKRKDKLPYLADGRYFIKFPLHQYSRRKPWPLCTDCIQNMESVEELRSLRTSVYIGPKWRIKVPVHAADAVGFQRASEEIASRVEISKY